MDSLPYLESIPAMFAHVRSTCGGTVELLHDIHERILPAEAISYAARWRLTGRSSSRIPCRRSRTTGSAVAGQDHGPDRDGELFNNPHEWVNLIKERLIDYIRVHITQTGGFTPARKIAALAEWFGVRTAWHGPGDLCPIGHAANLHLDLNIHNFGIQESVDFDAATREVFPGTHTLRNGYAILNDAPGWGVDFDEEKARKYPLPAHPGYWEPVRRNNGTAVRP